MARFFRSQEPVIGERVVVRRKDGDHHTDIIGHVTGVEPLRLRPQKVGGLPSEAPEITVPDEEIAVVRRLSPRRIRNSDIRAVETATAAAFPGREHRFSSDGQWLMRAGDGITERSNSATPLGPSAGFMPVPIEEITSFYRSHNLPVRLKIPERIGASAEKLVATGGFELGPEIIVMTAPVTSPEPSELPEGFTTSVDAQPDADWLARYHFRGQALPADALALLQTSIDGHLGFGRILSPSGLTVAITRGTVTSSPDGRTWLGYSAVEVDPAFRRRGLATALGRTMIAWGANHGADHAYLQVLGSNDAGIGLYNALGFIEHHRERYALQREA